MKLFQRFSRTILWIFFLLVSLIDANLLAQSGNESYRHITSRDGLSSGFIWDMMEDKNGFIWIATNVGLDKYDGYSITTFRNDPSDPTTITGGSVFTIFDDEDNLFWTGTSTGLSIFDTSEETFKQVQLPSDYEPIRSVRSVVKTDNDDIWAAGQRGVYRFPQQDLSADTLQTELFGTDALDDSFQAIYALASQGNMLWIASDSTLHKYDTEAKEFIDLPQLPDDFAQLFDGLVWGLFVDSNGTLWLSTETGLGRWPENGNPEVIKSLGPYDEETFTGGYFQALTEDSQKNLWISTGIIGALRYNLETGDVKTFRHDSENPNSISEDDVHFAFADQAGNTWFGYHNAGLSLMYSQAWTYSFDRVSDQYDSDHPLNEIHAYIEDEEGNGWLATHWGFGYLPADGGEFEYFPIYPDQLSEERSGNRLEAITISGQQILAISHNQEIHVFDMDSKSIQRVELPNFQDVFMVSGRLSDELDHFYFGAADPRQTNLLRINKTTLELDTLAVPHEELGESIQLTAVFPLVSPDGIVFIRFYMGSGDGISWHTLRFNPETEEFTELNLYSPEGQTIFGAPHLSNDGTTVWSLGNLGLIGEDLINETSQIYFQDDIGPFSESNRVMVEDEEGYFWLNNQTGITRLDPNTESISYFEADPNRKPETYFDPTIAVNGDIIFGGRGGYTRFNPNDLTTESPIQNIHITELLAGSDVTNVLENENRDFELGHDDNNISISYIGLNYRDPNYTRYRYRLSGYDDDWNLVGTQRRVFLANLPPGDYTFEVQAAQRFGGFSEQTAQISLSILPPWWQTMPAYLLFFLMFVGGVVSVDRFQRRRVIQKERERSREKELKQAKEIEKAYENLKAAQEQLVQQEKLASLGQLTAGIAHEIKNPLNFVNNFSDLSIELVEEAREEAKEKLPSQQLSELQLIATLDNIEANLRKIHEHGSRADSIVKSMLQHSRGGSNKMEPSDINTIIKEYVNLAFHGMRAGKKPINVDIELDLDEDIQKIPLISEDFSRVILNLCNNAFDAMRELSAKRSAQSDTYEPKLTVRTHQKGREVYIEIEDNGPGIPDEIKDKIFQPFFTTKKGTDGTGLGLSITHDIVKAHGGTLEITKKDEGTIMRVILNQS